MDHDMLMNRTSRDSLADLPQLMSMFTLWQGALHLGSQPVNVFYVSRRALLTVTNVTSLSVSSFYHLTPSLGHG